MKKVVLLLVMLNLFQHLCEAQTNVYHPFPDSNAVWNIHYFATCLGAGGAEDYYSFKMQGDTLMQTQTYHKLYIPYVESTLSGVCFGSGYSAGYQGALREDTAERKVYFVPPGQPDEELLYDFTMEVGDTVQGYLTSFEPVTVQEIDSVIVGNVYRKRWRINHCYSIDIIEGIGNTYGMIVQIIPCITDMPDYVITCFSQNDQTLYPENVSSCILITGVEMNEPQNQFTLYPNPANTFVTLSAVEGLTRNSDLQIHNAQGQLVSHSTFDVQHSTFDISSLSSGIYFLTLDNGEQTVSRKFVKE